MQVLQQKITDFTYSNLTETIALWNSTTTYAVGDEVRVGSFIYESVTASNVGNNPTETDGIRWLKSGVSNKYAMLDLRANTKATTVGGDTVVEFTQNYIDTLAIGNYEANYILVEILDELNVVQWSYQTPDSINSTVIDWWTWTYEPYQYEVNRGIMIRLPLVAQFNKVRVTFKYFSGINRTACGYLVGGNALSMGCTEYGINFSFNSFATKEFDNEGNIRVEKRTVQDLVDFNTVVKLGEKSIPQIKREIKHFYDDIVVFIVDEQEDSDYENLLTLGTVQDASIVLNNKYLYNIAWSVLEVV